MAAALFVSETEPALIFYPSDPASDRELMVADAGNPCCCGCPEHSTFSSVQASGPEEAALAYEPVMSQPAGLTCHGIPAESGWYALLETATRKYTFWFWSYEPGHISNSCPNGATIDTEYHFAYCEYDLDDNQLAGDHCSFCCDPNEGVDFETDFVCGAWTFIVTL